MAFEVEGKGWGYDVVQENGQFEGGYIIIDLSSDRYWTGSPKNNSPQEFLILRDIPKDSYKQYLIMYRYKNYGPCDKDYCRFVSENYAAEWLQKEGYELPEDLCKFSSLDNSSAPLPPMLQEIWNLLENNCYSAAKLAQMVENAPYSEETIRKRIYDLRRCGKKINLKRGRGYYRPDAPPADR